MLYLLSLSRLREDSDLLRDLLELTCLAFRELGDFDLLSFLSERVVDFVISLIFINFFLRPI